MNGQSLLQRRARYHLRFSIPPGPDVEGRAGALASFCQRCAIEEVVLFIPEGRWSNAPLSPGEIELWCDTLATCAHILRNAAIEVSLNPAVTVGHSDDGRRMHPDCVFTPMVSPIGEQAKAMASFACPLWRRYLAERFHRFATLGFRGIWLEDDFRYHNHPPLHWGGDFSPAMLERFARKLRQPVRREEVVAAILRPGEPHPWRAQWMEVWREAQLEAADSVRQAVQTAADATHLGLMSSHPSFHSIEGRDASQHNAGECRQDETPWGRRLAVLTRQHPDRVPVAQRSTAETRPN